MIAQKGLENLPPAETLAAEDLEQLFQLEAHLVDELLALVEVCLLYTSRCV